MLNYALTGKDEIIYKVHDHKIRSIKKSISPSILFENVDVCSIFKEISFYYDMSKNSSNHARKTKHT
ncbi:hypothetical protein BpHYR1_032396 [Brachionus plicatilis]|uniref:Uncharacterized protein n=1 Tax=Brachionus plicatilis TaxID=10195 RepID=A0A3M7SVB9_BRAPC|nr:hypothetical protein BpHYR1_032396 [Brachionus plicatilis]